MELARRVRKLREAKHLTREQLAVASGVSMGTIENVERGRPVLARTVQQVAKGLGVPVGTLYGEKAS